MVMNLLTALRPRNVQAERQAAPPRRAEKTRALLVNGQMQMIGELRSTYASGTARLLGSSLGITSGDYTPDQVATAYKTGVTTYIGVNVRCGISAEIPIHATDASGEAVNDSPAQIFVDNAPKFIWRLLAYQLIFGAIYIRKVRNRHGYPTGLELLSPLDVTPDLDYSKGTVARYCVRRPVGIEYIKPSDMIVDVTFNPFSDIDGTSAVEVAKVRSDIETAIGRYGAMFFANSARPDLVITTDAEMSEEQQKEARTRWEANFKGVLNSFRAAFLGGSKWEVKPIGYNPSDLAMVELTSQADMKILAVMRVAPILAGIGHASDPLSAQGTYEQARTQHLEFVAIPDVRQLCNILNEQWLHKDFADSPTTWTLEPDTAAILSSAMGTSDRITAANTAVTGHYWRVNEAREHTGKEPLPYAIDMNPDWAINLYDKGLIKRSQAQAAVGYAPATISRTDPDGFIYEVDPRAKAPPAPPSPFGMFGPPPQNLPGQNIAAPEPPKQIAAPAIKTIDVVPTQRAASDACYVILSLANDPAIMAMQAGLRGKYPDVEWSTPDSFHVTLVYSPQTADLNAVKQILPRSINEFSFKVGPVSSFDGKDKTPIILTVDAPVELLALQSGLAASFQALGLELSEYSIPDNWHPHVTLGYIDPALPVPESDQTVTVSSSTIICSIEAGQSFQNIYVTRAKAEKSAQLHELSLWSKRVKAKGVATRFTAELLPGDVAAWVRSALAEEWNPAAVFDAARAWVRTGQLPDRAGFVEDQHPRDPSGKFGDKPGVGDGKKPGGDKPTDKKPKQPAVSPTPPSWANADRPGMPDDEGFFDYAHMKDSHSRDRSTSISQTQANHLDGGQKEALTNYTGTGLYRDVNDFYRGKSANLSSEATLTAKHLDTAISQAKLPENTVLYRGMHLSPEQVKGLKPGASLSDKGFSSTSFGQNVAQSYLDKGGSGGVIMRIKAPRGSHALAVEAASDYPEEKEVLLPRNSKLNVTKVSKGANGRLYVDAVLGEQDD